MHSRVAIIGNAGSGKSYLAAAINAAWGLPVVGLDSLFWMPGGYVEQRPKDVVRAEIEQTKAREQWIFEGVYGELIDLLLDRAECLIWLDIDWDTCRQSLQNRHLLNSRIERDKIEASFKVLLDYAAAYWSREDLRSFSGHRSIFTHFPHAKWHLRSRKQVSDFVHTLQA